MTQNSPSGKRVAEKWQPPDSVQVVIDRLLDVPVDGQLYLWQCTEQATETDQQRGTK